MLAFALQQVKTKYRSGITQAQGYLPMKTNYFAPKQFGRFGRFCLCLRRISFSPGSSLMLALVLALVLASLVKPGFNNSWNERKTTKLPRNSKLNISFTYSIYFIAQRTFSKSVIHAQRNIRNVSWVWHIAIGTLQYSLYCNIIYCNIHYRIKKLIKISFYICLRKLLYCWEAKEWKIESCCSLPCLPWLSCSQKLQT